MARRKNRRKAEQAAAATVREQQQRRSRWLNRLILAGLPLLLIAGAWLAWSAHQRTAEFTALVEAGQPALAEVRSEPSRGRDHVPPGTPVAEGEDFPVSGTHWPTWTDPGFYTEPDEKGRLIHSLEHGLVVIYYGDLSAGAERQLRAWTRQFNGDWSGLVVVPHPRLANRDRMVLTAWRHRLELDAFDPAAIAAFLDEYRGKGPENPVR